MQERDNKTLKTALCLSMVAVWLFGTDCTVGRTWILYGQFQHANFFHLAANAYAFLFVRCTYGRFIAAYTISAVSLSICPPAIGMSSVLYALVGMEMQERTPSLRTWLVFLMANAITAFLPGISLAVHAVSFVLGFACSYVKKIYDDYSAAYRGRPH